MPVTRHNTTNRTAYAAPLFATLLLTLLMSPSSGSATEAEAKKKPEKSPDDVICKREKISGSHMKQRICFTREQWDDIRRNSQTNAAAAMRGGGPITPQ